MFTLFALVSSSLPCVLAFAYVPTSTYLFLSTSFAPLPPSSPCMLASTFLLHVHFVHTYSSIATLCDSFPKLLDFFQVTSYLLSN